MGRRRWRFVSIAAILIFMTKDIRCQDENDFFYTPVERSYAQVQPPLYPNNRPSTYFDQEDSYRAVSPTHQSSQVQQPLYNEGRVRFPSPNYNQNPSPFQLPTGRSQSGSQYYVNQPDFTTPQRQRYRLSLPNNYQLLHPASTKRPDISQIHSVAYQNDPSKPETFLGQVTINNPDIDFLQSNRFKNIPFDGNSLKSNIQTHHSNDEDIDSDNQDLYDHHRVTTYNPNKLSNRQRVVKVNPGRFPHYEGDPPMNDQTLFPKTPSKIYLSSNKNSKSVSNAPYHDTSTEYKTMLDIEPLLEDDISDISSFRELMKNKQESYDVQVIKSNHSDDSEKFDSNPSASSMNTDFPKAEPPKSVHVDTTSNLPPTNKMPIQKTKETINENEEKHQEHSTVSSEEVDHEDTNNNEGGEEEYVEYYDDGETTETTYTTTQKSLSTEHPDEYEEYDAPEEEETEHEQTEETKTPSNSDPKHNSTESFDVLIMQPNNTMVKDDNFQQFVDTTIIDQLEQVSNESTTDSNIETAISSEEIAAIDNQSIVGQEVVSVVTTKSVVNGTISVPNVSYNPTTSRVSLTTKDISKNDDQNNGTIPVTTENWIVVASVQTSRSVSGARFLPFPTVEQEEKKQVIDEDEEDHEDNVTKNPKEEETTVVNPQTPFASTENINDKLDSIQSELSSAVLSGALDTENKNIEIIKETTTTTKQPTTSTTTTTTPTALNVFTTRSTESPLSTERSSPDPLPVLIKKFTPRASTTTTPKPKKKLVTVMDELPSGFLPPGYKPRLSFKDKRITTTTPTTTTSTTTSTESPILSSEEDNINGTQGRSSGISSKNKVIIRDEKTSNKNKDFKPKESKTRDENLSKVQPDILDKLLPPGYKSTAHEAKINIFDKVQEVDISAFLPKDFKLNTTTEKPKTVSKILPIAKPVDISAFLPPGFKLNTSESDNKEETFQNKSAGLADLLPPDFILNKSEEVSSTTTNKTPSSSGGIKLVFPSRPGGKTIRKTTPKPVESGPPQVTPKILKGWPTRASTEFTGWPSPSTTPFSIEKLLEAQRNATATSAMPDVSTEITTRRTTTTTTTTPEPPAPTTPGICKADCDIAATIKIVAGVKWVPELLDHHTEEWQKLAQDVKDELNSVYSKADLLSKWYKGIRIDGFSEGSVLVDFFIELNDVENQVDTLELKKLFHKSLHEARAGSYVETISDEIEEPEFNPDAMLGDQPEEERMKKSNEKMTKTIDKSAGKLEIGKFVMDPAYTEFIVLPKREIITTVAPDEESFLPQWGIAVIVIAMASLLFVVIFGVTVLVNRQKSSKAKQPIPLSEDMLRELDKSHMGGFDDLHQLKERELPYHPPGKRMSTAFIEQLAYPNPGDSWRSEWTPQLQKYMHHYTPDSGRGSQIYGTGGNGGYGYGGGSQLYGQTGGGGGGGGGGSQIYGYTGEYPVPRSHYSRRRSEYDSNF